MGKGISSKDPTIAHQKKGPAPGADRGDRGRGDRLIQERVHDPYKTRSKLPEPTVCPECQAVFTQGRWSWTEVPAEANQTLCPACQRIRDRVPAGFLSLSGEFFQNHREEILNLIRNKEQSEKAQHPLKRIMNIEEQEQETVLTFTEIHLPRGIGEALQRAYEGKLDYQYAEQTSILRVRWRR
jgi:NMD protein affecting ribosome stability and mRNA decay